MLGPAARSRARLAFAVAVTALGGSVLLSSGTSSSAAPTVVRPMGPAVPAPGLRPLVLAGGSLLGAPVLRSTGPVVPVGPPATATRRTGPAATVGPGAPPGQVRQAQRLLNAAGAGLRVDGAWGPATARAVEQVQRQRGLPVTGRFDPLTAAALGA